MTARASLPSRIHQTLVPAELGLGRLPYVWLVYLLFLLLPLSHGAGGLRFWLPTLLAVTVFLPLYFWAYRLSGWWVLAATLPMLGLFVLLGPYNPSALCFAVYAAAFSTQLGSMRRGLLYLACVLAIGQAVVWLQGLPMPFILMTALMQTLIGGTNLVMVQMERKNAELKLSQQEVRRLAGKAERERIARDLHDLLGHTLSVIVRKVELARRLIAIDAARAAAELAEVEGITRQALAEVREAVSGWRAPELAAESASARLVLESAGIRAQVDDPPDIPGDAARALAMVLREAVTNVIRHSGAAHCRIEFERSGPDWQMRVADDGRGGSGPEGNGLTGIRERLAAVGGGLELGPGPGWTLLARVPTTSTEIAA